MKNKLTTDSRQPESETLRLKANGYKLPAHSAGFTLVELLVSISIMVLIMSVVLINYHRFDTTFSTTNLAYDIALSIRQAQSYGISVHANTTISNNTNNAQYQFGYGIHFSGADDTHYILFADNTAGQGTEDYYDSTSGNVCGGECLQEYTLTSGYSIVGICTYSSDASVCNNLIGSSGTVDITFLRPDPDAIVCQYSSGNYPSCSLPSENTAVITIASPDTSVPHERIIVQPTGQISVQQVPLDTDN